MDRILEVYDISVLYYLDKGNVVVDGLSQMSMTSVVHVVNAKKKLNHDVHRVLIGIQYFI